MTPRTGLLTIGALAVPVTVTDTRTMIGRAEFQVTPLGGRGTVWVTAARLTLNPERFEPSPEEVAELDAALDAGDIPA